MSLREALMIAIAAIALMTSVAGWMVMPHRTTALEEAGKDRESRIRMLETVRVDLAEIKADLREIKRRVGDTE